VCSQRELKVSVVSRGAEEAEIICIHRPILRTKAA
jgi:hypothetical protein